MRLLSFRRDGRPSYGCVVGDGIVDLGRRLAAEAPDLRALLARDALRRAAEIAGRTAADCALTDVEVLKPVPHPEKFLCVGVNYRDRNEEYKDGSDLPRYPSLFFRMPGSLVADGEPIVRPPESEQLDYEGEIALVIGRAGRRIPESHAMDYVAGYSCVNEGTIRDWLRHGKFNVTPGKNFERTGAFGPYLVTRDEVDEDALSVTTRVNGDVRQHDTIDRLMFSFPALIAYISTFCALTPGAGLSSHGGPRCKRQEVGMSDSTATVTASGIASLAGVGRAAVSNWRRRYADFPQPVGGSATSPAFDLRAVENWLQEQGKVPEIPAEERTWRRIEAFGMPEHAGDALSLTGAFLLAEASGQPEAVTARKGRRGAGPAASLLPAPELAARVDRWGGYARHLLVQLIPREWSAQQEELLRFARELAARRGAEDAFEYLCSRYAAAGTLPGHYATPPVVAELMLDLAGDAKVILDFACGSGNILRTAANHALERGAPLTCYGQDVSKTQARITLLRLLFISSRAGIAPDGESSPHIADRGFPARRCIP